MANAEPSPNPPPPPQSFSPLGALLSYLVPGLGQIVQGRIGKGLLFLVCLYGLFFYGLHLGHWHNVYVPSSPPPREGRNGGGTRLLDSITDRARFAGQFWIGIAAWPAILQSLNGTPYVEMPDGSHGKIVLPSNFPTPEVRSPTTRGYPLLKRLGDAVEVDIDGKPTRLPIRGLPLLGTLMGEPDEWTLNEELRNADKKYELGWMYTVIAGVLNILVIYDAFAGPAFVVAPKKPAPRDNEPVRTEEKKEEAAVA